MGLAEKEVCIKCEKGGEVLACADSHCPIAVHERCMGCPVRFDELGKFYCPYCLYKNIVAKLRQEKDHCLSKKQALYTFLDKEKEMIGNNKEMPLLVRNSTRERLDEPLPEKETDVPQSSHDQQFVVGQQIQSGAVADNGKTPSDNTSRKATEADLTVLETGNRVQINDLQEHQLEKSVEDHKQESNISNSLVAEEEKLGNELVQEETEGNSVDIVGEKMTGVDQTDSTVMNDDATVQQHRKGKRRVETRDSTHGESKPVSTHRKSDQHIVGEKTTGVDQADSTFMNDDATVQQHRKGKRIVETRDSTHGESKPVSTNRKSGQQVDKVKDEPTSNSSRRLTRASTSFINGNGAGQLVQVKQPIMQLPTILPNGKRRRVLWSDEEEEMLEEGVKTFSTEVNKNIPWRKILEFGSHVFDQTRTPTDLKDKWKNICSKYGGKV